MTDPSLDRRTLLRLGALDGGRASAAPSCSPRAVGRATTRARARRTASSTTTTVADPSTPWWLRGNFAPVTREVEAFDLPVEGTPAA